MRITEVVRVQNPMGGDYKSQLDRDRAAAAVRAQRQANREAGKNTAGAKSGTDPQKGLMTPGRVQTKSYNNALTKQFARPAGQGKGLDIMGKPLQQPVQRKIEPAQQEPQQPTTAPATPDWVGQNTNIPAVQRKQQSQQAQQQTQPTQQTEPQQTTQQPAAQTTATTGTSAPADTTTAPTNTQNAKPTGQIQGVKQKINPAFVKEFDGIVDVTPKFVPHVIDAKARVWVKTGQGWQSGNRTIERDDSTYITFDNAWREANGFPTAEEGTMMGSPANNQPKQAPASVTGRPNPYMTPQANTPAEPEQQTQTMPSEPVKIGGQKLNPSDPADAKILQMIQKQLPQMPTPQVAAEKKAADKTLKRRKNKPKQRF